MATNSGRRLGTAPGHSIDPHTPRSAAAAPSAAVDHLWSAVEVSAYLGVPVATLHQWRYRGSGPDAYRVGRHLRYDPASVHRWLDESCRSAG